MLLKQKIDLSRTLTNCVAFILALCNLFEFTIVVRGFNVHKKVWKPKKRQLLNCFYENGNISNPLAIKVCERRSDRPVGQLSREISKVTKFILDRGALVDVVLTSIHYRRSPLVQDKLEVKCKVAFKTPNRKVTLRR